MLDLIVFVKSSGANVRLDNLYDMVNSFIIKNKNLNYKFYFAVDSGIESSLSNMLKEINQENLLMKAN